MSIEQINRTAKEVVCELLTERCPDSDSKMMAEMFEFVSKVEVEDPTDKKKVRKALRVAGKQWLKERGLWQTKERDRLAPLGHGSQRDSAKDQDPELDPESSDDQTSQQLTELAQESADECGAYGMTASEAIRCGREKASDDVGDLLKQASPDIRAKLSEILRKGGPQSLRATAREIGLKHPEELKRLYGAAAKQRGQKLLTKGCRNAPGKSGLAWPYEPLVVSPEAIMSTPGAPCITYWKDLRTSASRRKRTLKAKSAPDIYELPVPRRAHKVTHKRFGHGVVLQKRDTDSGEALIVQFDDGSRRIVLSGEDYFGGP
jgi:hypothetical protein